MRSEERWWKRGIAIVAAVALILGLSITFALNMTPAQAADFSWTATGGTPATYGTPALECDAVHDILYAGFDTTHGIWRCSNPESAPFWIQISGSPGPGDVRVDALKYDATRNVLYVAIHAVTEQVWRCSTPNTIPSWSKISIPQVETFADINGMACDSSRDILYVCDTEDIMSPSGQGVWRCSTPDASPSWSKISTSGDVGDINIGSVVYDDSSNIIYASGYPEDVWRCTSPDSSPGWTNLGSAHDGWSVAMALDKTRSILYTRTWKGLLYRCSDLLASPSWTGIGTANDDFGGIAYDSQRNELYAGVRQSVVTPSPPWGVKRCVNPNATPIWSNTGGSVASYQVERLALGASGNTLFAGTTANGVWEAPLPIGNTFYFAEGYTGNNFQEYISLGNPGSDTATADITYMFKDGSTKQQHVSISNNSRFTINVNAEVGAGQEVSARIESQQKIIAERPMYFNYQGVWTGGSDAVGATSPAGTWYFAEGYTGPGFDEWLCVLNPGDAPANLTFAFQTQEEGEKKVEGLSVPAHSRGSFKANELLGGISYQTSLKLTSDQPVVAERPMYFDYAGTGNWHWTGGHCVMGVPALSKQYYFAEGTTRSGFEEWLTLQNPGILPITIHAVYQKGPGQGDPVEKDYPVEAGKRSTILVNGEVGTDKDVSIYLSSDTDFLAERPIYFRYSYTNLTATGGHCVIGAPSTASEWFLAEGFTGSGFNEWLCLQNPGDSDATCEITYYTQESGALPAKTVTVSAKTRKTIMVNEDAGAGYQLSTRVRVIAGSNIVIERPIYFIYNGWDGGHDVVGYMP